MLSAWDEFFKDPSLWCDNGARIKETCKQVRHSQTSETLWLKEKLADLEISHRGNRGSKVCYKPTMLEGREQVTHRYVYTLQQCSKTRDLEGGRKLHIDAVAANLATDKYVVCALINMYMKCGRTYLARGVFDSAVDKNVVMWNSLLLGYVENGESHEAMDLFSKMDCEATHVTYIAALKASTGLASEGKQVSLDKGIAIHERVRECGLESNILVANSLVEMYSKCGSLHQAQCVFDKMIHKDVVIWTCLIVGYMENGENSVAIDLFTQMDCEPNDFTYVATLEACGNLGALPSGQYIHAEICKVGLEEDQVVGSTLVNFYAKCGSMAMSEEFFHSISSPSIVSWTALLSGYTSLGNSYRVFSLVEKIDEAGIQMDGIMLKCILSACSHAGLVDQGKKYFEYIVKFGITPCVEHYNCIVDILGRANRLHEAQWIVNSMPMKANRVTWTTLLAACRKWRNFQVGKAAFDALVAADSKDAAAYVLMRDLYGSLSMSDDRDRMDAEINGGPRRTWCKRRE